FIGWLIRGHAPVPRTATWLNRWFLWGFEIPQSARRTVGRRLLVKDSFVSVAAGNEHASDRGLRFLDRGLQGRLHNARRIARILFVVEHGASGDRERHERDGKCQAEARHRGFLGGARHAWSGGLSI